MRGLLVCAVALPACTFQPRAALPNDAAIDSCCDAPIDGPGRVREGLVALWTFDEAAGATTAGDTSGTAMPVPLSVIVASGITAPTFGTGSAVATAPARVISDYNTHIPRDCQAANGVTLEAWVQPAMAIQGTATEPRFIAGIASSVTQRDIALLQRQDGWMGLVRTGAMLDGSPALHSTSHAMPTAMTHIVIVADSTTRAMYINGVLEASTTAGAPTGWDPSYRVALFDEPQHARPWLGGLALVAVYARALSPAEISQNFMVGDAAP